ncbi:hypothetical protein M422DRAFT_26814, partial [Sphaerobolus stellatus SS14]
PTDDPVTPLKKITLKENPAVSPNTAKEVKTQWVTTKIVESATPPGEQLRNILKGIPSVIPAAEPIMTIQKTVCGTVTYTDLDDVFETLESKMSGKGKPKIWNLATIPPVELKAQGLAKKYLKKKGDNHPASLFFTLRVIMHSGVTCSQANPNSYQVTVMLPTHLGPCIFTNITKAANLSPKVWVPSYKSGINCSTRKKGSEDTNDFPVRRFHPVDVHDARKGLFALGKIDTLPVIPGELSEGDRVLVTYTVSWYDWREGDEEGKLPKTPQSPNKKREDGYSKALSLNLQQIVLLERDGDHDNAGEKQSDSEYSDSDYM